VFGELQVTRVQKLTREETLDEATGKLLDFTEHPRILRWFQFPSAVVVFLAHDNAPDGGAIYVYDRKRCVWLGTASCCPGRARNLLAFAGARDAGPG
jgi:hypothetical protein